MKDSLDSNPILKEDFKKINLQNAGKSIELSKYFLQLTKLFSGYTYSRFSEPMIQTSQLVRKLLHTLAVEDLAML